MGDILNLARKAGGRLPGSTAAKAQLVDLAQVNPEARAAAERLGIDVPFDVLSDNPQVRSAVGLTRALVAGEAEAAWENTVRQAIQRADEISQQFDAAFVAGRPAPGATSQKIVDNLQQTRQTLKSDAKAIYDGPKDAATQYFRRVATTDLKASVAPVIDDALKDVGAVAAYDQMIGKYKTVPFVPDIKADLTGHATDLALEGLFRYLAGEEAAIRDNPAKRTTELLAKVFGAK